MNIDINTNVAPNGISSTSSVQMQENDSASFANELSNLQKTENKEGKIVKSDDENSDESTIKLQDDTTEEVAGVAAEPEAEPEAEATFGELNTENPVKIKENCDETNKKTNVSFIIDSLEGTVAEITNKLNQTDECFGSDLKFDEKLSDKSISNEDNILINNGMNVQELKEELAFQMNASMNFNSDGQQFSELMNNQKNNTLQASVSDIAEENNILSSMEENVAIANRNKALIESKMKTVTNNEGIKKIDEKTNIIVETVVKFDDIAMSKSDVDFFSNLVENNQVEMTHETIKSSQISKTLADMLAKAMKDNQPIRIDFDNNISVIIKIGKDGKISADFLPSSQVAEAYLKENLPLLKQRFDENNIEYDSLNQRKQKQEDKGNQKKERKDE